MKDTQKIRTSTIFYIVRHGETEWNVQHLMQGHRDSPLTPVGISQVKELAIELDSVQLDLVYSSDLGRAKHTAKLLVQKKRLRVRTSKLLRESSFGKHEGKTFQEYFDLYEKALTLEKQVDDKTLYNFKADSDVESPREIMDRFIRLLKQITRNNPGKTVLLVSHGGLMRHLLYHSGHKSYKELPHGAIDHTAYIKVAYDGTAFEILETKGVTFLEVNP